jgi:dTMP kinase
VTGSLFVSFEGPDGSGKSTQARRLAAWLHSQGCPVTLTREPGGTPLGDRLRELVLDPGSPPGSTLSVALMLAASRAQLVDDVIRPALARDEIVIVDRYADSTLAYQGYGAGLDLHYARQLTDIATRGLWPDLTLYVDVPPEVGLQRVRARGPANRLDGEAIDFHRRVRAGYLQMIAEQPQRWRCVDGTLPVDDVEQTIREAIEPLLARVSNAL